LTYNSSTFGRITGNTNPANEVPLMRQLQLAAKYQF